MKAVYISEFGSPENLEIREIQDPPSLTGNEVLVRVRAAGLNRADLLQVRGLYPPPEGYSPNIPGLEFAGEIAAIGPQVNDWSIGDRVFGITAGEAQAEFIVSDATLLAKIPANLNFVEAAAVPEAFITAQDAIFSQGQLGPGESLLIHAVGSGVGLAALQIAKAKGAFVIGTTRTADKLEKCREFGIDVGILTSNDSQFAAKVLERTDNVGVEVILDLVGAAYFSENLASLAVKGRLVLVGLTSGANAEFDLRLALRKRATIIGTVLRARSLSEKGDVTRKFTEDILPLFENGTIHPNLDRVFDCNNVVAAYKYLESNESFGKVVLEF